MKIGNLHLHVQKGYLSDIPLDEHNKRLDHLLNRSLISGATLILVELAIYQRIPYFYTHPVTKSNLLLVTCGDFKQLETKAAIFKGYPNTLFIDSLAFICTDRSHSYFLAWYAFKF